MRESISALLALGAILWLALSAPALAQTPPRTVSDYANALSVAAGLLDTQISERQRQGDMAAAQRLVLIVAMVRRSGEEFRAAEQENLTEDLSTLPAPIPARVKAALEMAAKAVETGADDVAFVAHAHKIANDLIAAAPPAVAHPVVYGLLSRDLAGATWTAPGDIVFYGYRLFDPIYKTVPTVLFGRDELAPGSVVVNEDTIDVTLPPEVRAAIHFAPDACAQRPGFTLRVRDTYAQPRGFWPFRWHFEVLTNADFSVLQTPVFYAVQTVTSVEAVKRTEVTATFSEKSGFTSADCETTSAAEAVFSLPEGATDAVCAAKWVDTTNAVKLSSRCVVKDGAARATGQLSAGAKSCSPDKLCACSTPAQGWLEASGSYSLPKVTSQMSVSKDEQTLTFPAGGVAARRLTIANDEKLRHVALEISRRDCPVVVDVIDLNIGEDPNAQYSGVSKTGAFRASLSRGELRVGAADRLAEGAKTP